VRECCKGDDASQWENGKFDPLPPRTPSPIVTKSCTAHVITSWISTDKQNLVAIPPGVSFPRMREIAHQNVYSASFLGASNELQPRRLNRFSSVIPQTTRFRARMCFSVLEDKNLTFTQRNSRKTAIFAPDFDGT